MSHVNFLLGVMCIHYNNINFIQSKLMHDGDKLISTLALYTRTCTKQCDLCDLVQSCVVD